MGLIKYLDDGIEFICWISFCSSYVVTAMPFHSLPFIKLTEYLKSKIKYPKPQIYKNLLM